MSLSEREEGGGKRERERGGREREEKKGRGREGGARRRDHAVFSRASMPHFFSSRSGSTLPSVWPVLCFSSCDFSFLAYLISPAGFSPFSIC